MILVLLKYAHDPRNIKKMVKSLLLAIAFPAILSATLFAQPEPGEEEVQANPGRPTLSTPATLTPAGYLQFESGVVTARHSPEFSSQTNINEVIKLSFCKRLQLLTSFQPVVGYRVDRQSAITGISGVSAGLQAVLYPGEGPRPTVSISYARGIYGGSPPDFDIGSPLNSVLLLTSADVKQFHYDVNFFTNDVKQNQAHRPQFGQSLSISHALGTKLQLTGELYHFTQPFLHAHAAASLWALSYSATKLLVIDSGFSHGLTATSTRWQVFAGFTYVLPHKLWR